VSETEAVVKIHKEKVPGKSEAQDLPFPVDSSACTDAQRQKLEALLQKHADIFIGKGEPLGFTDRVKHTINLTDNVPVRQPFRRIPPTQYEEVKQHLQELLDQGIIRQSHSPYASPMVLVRKSCGALRICIDYRQLNMKTIKDAYPLPRIEETLDSMHGSEYFSCMDLTSGYYQVALAEEDKEKSAFCTAFGLYEYNRMAMGLCNAPATFQRLMQNCFQDDLSHENGSLFMNCLLVYLDDLICYNKTFEDHLDSLERVFNRLRECGLKLNPKKCQFLKKEVSYLGHVISSHGVATDSEKIRAVKEWVTPTCVKELQSFLGLAGYYRRYVKDFSKIAKPLHALCTGPTDAKRRKSFGSLWTEECDTAFCELKKRLTTAPVLAYADFTKEFSLEIDASYQGLGAVLMQEQNGQNKVIAYASRGLRPNERNMSNYSSMKLELLALKWAVTEKFKDYLYGKVTTVFTDNNPLCYFNSTAKLGAVEQRWEAQLAPYLMNRKVK